MGYDKNYESDLIRGIEEPRPWDIVDVVKQYARSNDRLLDIGCGTALKLIQLAEDVREIYGIDPNDDMLAQARRNITSAGIQNIDLRKGRDKEVPFSDEYFDIVTCMVAKHHAPEINRVLRQGGYAILEKIGDRDKWDIKQEFGSNEDGPRGQHAHYGEGELGLMYRGQFLDLGFSEVNMRNEFWKCWLTLEGLILLLEQTPTIGGFDKEEDREIVKRISEKFMTEKGIEIQQNRILIVARK